MQFYLNIHSLLECNLTDAIQLDASADHSVTSTKGTSTSLWLDMMIGMSMHGEYIDYA